MTQVLLMSNDPIFKSKSVEAIAKAGYRVTEVSDAFDGLLLVDRDGFSTIIIDEELADIDGYRAFEKTRQYSRSPLILIGTEPPEVVWSRVSKEQFDVYLKKPVSPVELVEQIKIAVKGPFSDEVTGVAPALETAPEKPVEPVIELSPPVNPPVETALPVEVPSAPTTSGEKTIKKEAPPRTDSMEVMVADLERQVLKIKTAIIQVEQLRNMIDETKGLVSQQHQGLNSVENKLLQINERLKDILGETRVP